MEAQPICHVAVPSRSLAETLRFYVDLLGAKPVRQNERRICLNFHGMQLVCHNSPDDISPLAEIYPRHFGLVFRTREGFQTMLDRVSRHEVEILWGPSSKHEAEDDEQIAFYIKDPSNNVVEFKYYTDPAKVIGTP